jgi:hypothetical protein
VQAILACRTLALGGEVYRCHRCQRDHFVYHSCNHRACPQCGHADATHWIEQQKRKLVPAPYWLITFTVPAGLRDWLRSHQKMGYSLLLKESAAALQEVAQRAKYLGAQLGILSVLQTWGRQLQYHPHVHCVVPGGGLQADGSAWCRPPAADYFLPQAVLAARFRTRLKNALRSQPSATSIPSTVWQQPWVVDVQPVGSGQGAIKYLAAYVYRTALGAERIIGDQDGKITFNYKDSDQPQWRTLSLQPDEFIRRFLQHVLPQGFQRVRYYGWLSAAATAKWKRILLLLHCTRGQPQPQTPQPEPLCPQCRQPLCWIGTLARAPPIKAP